MMTCLRSRPAASASPATFLLAFAAVAAVYLCTPAAATAGCYCGGIPQYCFGDPPFTPGTVVVAPTYRGLANDSKNIGSCPYPGATPGEKTCDVSGTSTDESEWEVTGGIHYSYFEVNAKVGGKKTYTGNCGGPVKIDSWCSCCRTRARVKFSYKTGTLVCSCTNYAGTSSCSRTYNGTIKRCDGVVCDEPGCTVPADCDPSC